MPNLSSIEALNSRFGRDGVTFEPGQQGLPMVSVKTPRGAASIYLHGAHVTFFKPEGQPELLWVSKKSHFAPGKAIRGGVPLIFPWFGPKAQDPAAPQHGLVRSVDWEIDEVQNEPNDVMRVSFKCASSAQTMASWPFEFELRYHVRVSDTLRMTLEAHNTGSRDFSFEEALHSYLPVSDVRTASVAGLEGVTYIDKTDGMTRKTQAQAISIESETDRIYVNTSSACTLRDPGSTVRIIVEKENSLSTVIWNPWIDKAQAMSDFGDGEWKNMICIETCNVAENGVCLQPGKMHAMTAIIRAQELP